MSHFIDVIIPLNIPNLFTYKITAAEASYLKTGMRVAVGFGKSGLYTALVRNIHQQPPTAYEAKEIHQILDEKPIVTPQQLAHWEWISSYYMCALGEVMRSALPSSFLLQSETIIELNTTFDDFSSLNSFELEVVELLQKKPQITIKELSKSIEKKKILPLLRVLIEKKAIHQKEEIYEQYRPKLIKYIRLAPGWESEGRLQELLEVTKRAQKQQEVLLAFFQLKAQKKPVKATQLAQVAQVAMQIIKSLVDKQIFEYYYLQTDRLDFNLSQKNNLFKLSTTQQTAFQQIQNSFKTKQVCLLHGVTGSGKTQIYIHLIKKCLDEGKQVLYLLPEIALTTQIIEKLQSCLGKYLSVFHSKYNLNERTEVWNNVLAKEPKAQLVLGARSAMNLPFSDLGLIVVDEEHETSYKQFNPAPRYHARDASIVLANIHGAKVLLGSATPSIESFDNSQNGKYGYVSLNERFNKVSLPKIELINLKIKYKKKLMKGHFSDDLMTMIQQALDKKKQIILFQNRRGYAPMLECNTCGHVNQCPNCDVSLTYHNFSKSLQCHLCGHKQAVPRQCNACGGKELQTKGFGTEQIETEVQSLFPEAKVGRMDFDTTRAKHGYQKIISLFKAEEIDILVGTQMLAKGLDFSNVALVGVLNADNLLNFPDFRSFERSFQLLTQVAGRSGRSEEQGLVAIQSFNPQHQILQQVVANDYQKMFEDQLQERSSFLYPPYCRMIRITLQFKNAYTLDNAANWLGKAMSNSFGNFSMGPSVPSISRVRNQYIRNITLKIPLSHSIKQTKNQLQRLIDTFQTIKDYRRVKLIVDVDAY